MRHALLLGLVFLLSACATTSRESPVAAPGEVFNPRPIQADGEEDPEGYDRLVIVGTNDFHGYLRTNEGKLGDELVKSGGAEWFAGYVNILERKYGDSLILLDGGDMWQGTIDSNLFHGKSVVAFYNLLPYRAVALGNHEFDYGSGSREAGKDPLGIVRARMAESHFPYVQANIFWKSGASKGKVWREKNLQPSVLVEAGGYKVGIIGLTTDTTPAKTLPKNVQQLEFRDFVKPTLEEAAKLRAKGAEIVLITTHEGEGKEGDPIYNLLHALPKGTVDGVVAGHSHTEVHEFVNGVPVIESRTRGLFFGRFDLFVSRETRKLDPSLTKIYPMQPICGTWFKEGDSCDFHAAKEAVDSGKESLDDLLPLRVPVYEGEEVAPDPSVQGALAPYFAKAEKKRAEVLGRAMKDFAWYPSGENQVGTLILDGFHHRFPEAKVALMNGGGIRRMISKGLITYGDLYEVNPFDNVATLVKVTGKQMKEIVKPLVSGAHKVPAVWGIRVTYFNRDDSAFDRDVNGDGKKEKWERDRLHPEKGVVWDSTGKPLRDDEEFWLATLDYLVAGGDHLGHVFEHIPLSKRKYFDQAPRDLIADYLRAYPGVTVPREDKMRLLPIKGEGADSSIEQ